MRAFVALIFLGLLLSLSCAQLAMGDGSDPMPACRGRVCPPVGLN